MRVHEFFPLSTILYYRIGGQARFLLEARSEPDVLEAVEFVRSHGIGRMVVVGDGANLLFPDGLFDGAVLRLTSGPAPQIAEVGEGLVDAFGGEELGDVITAGFDMGYAGLEWAGGLPGTVGAAVRGNVGAFGGEIKDVLESAQLLENGTGAPEIRRLSNADLRFAYRESLVKGDRRLIVLSARFSLPRAEPEELARAREVHGRNIEYRQTNHPMEYPTCGSTFKNIAGKEQVERVLAVWPDARGMVEGRWHGKFSVGYAINRLGLTGYRVGDAQVSPKHSNFVVNLGGATFADVHAIIQEVRERFTRTFGFAPEPEVEIVGQDL